MNQDKEFASYMQGKSALSQAYADLPDIALPDHLDAAILAEAHRAVGARPGGMGKRRWAVPLGMVASLFLVVMIGLQMPYLLQDSAIPPLPREESASVIGRDKSVAAPAAPKAEALAPRNEPALSGNISAAPAMQSKPLATPKEQVAAPEVAAKRSRSDGLMDSAQESVLSVKKKAESYEQGVGNNLLEAPAAATMAAPAPAARESAELKKDPPGAAYSSPEEWLAHIRSLKQQGKLDEAKIELANFKQRYPNHPVPGELEIR